MKSTAADDSDLPWHRLDFMQPIAELRTGSAVGPRLHVVGNQGDRRGATRAATPTVVFLHGVLRNWRSFYPVLAPLRGEANLVAVDFRGHGRSGTARDAYRVIDYVDDAVRVVDSLPGELILYGHSLGAMVALAACARRTDRIRAAVLEDPPMATMGSRLPDLPLLRYFQAVQQCLEGERAEQLTDEQRGRGEPRPEHVSRLFEKFSDLVIGERADGTPIRVRDERDLRARRFAAESLARLDPAVLPPITSGQWLEGYETAQWLAAITAEVQVLQADSAVGGMLTESDAAGLRQGLGDRCTVSRFEGVGHGIHWSQPANIVAVVRGLL